MQCFRPNGRKWRNRVFFPLHITWVFLQHGNDLIESPISALKMIVLPRYRVERYSTFLISKAWYSHDVDMTRFPFWRGLMVWSPINLLHVMSAFNLKNPQVLIYRMNPNFWARSYFVSTVGTDEEVVCSYQRSGLMLDRQGKLEKSVILHERLTQYHCLRWVRAGVCLIELP
jgi:hypothetical protein